MIKLVGNHYFLRTPLYPVGNAQKCLGGDICELVDQKEFLYGLYIASRDLYEEYMKQVSEGKITEKMRHSLQKYYVRASTRCTPYANFAGCAIGTFSDQTSIYLEDPLKHAESCRLDMDLIYRFLDVLYKDGRLKSQLIYYTNSSLYLLGDKYRYVRYKFNGKRSYFLSEMEVTPYLRDVVSICGNGATIGQISLHLKEYGFGESEVVMFVESIIQNQILTSELEPGLSGDDPFTMLTNILRKYQGTENYIAFISSLNDKLKTDHFNIERLFEIISSIKDKKIDTSISTFFQCDVNSLASENTISVKVVNTILDQINDLLSVFKPQFNRSENLENFKRAFVNRYEQQTIPLCEALDVENGIGYGAAGGNINAFIRDVKFGHSDAAGTNSMVEYVNKQLNTKEFTNAPIHITRDDLGIKKRKSTAENIFNTQQSLYLMGTLYGSSKEAIDAGEFKFWSKLLGGTSHAPMLARFAHINSDIGHWIKELVVSEEAEAGNDTIYAEIIHLPQERLGNISQRPVLRGYEIPYLGNSGIDRSCQIPITDLCISIKAGQIVLKSKKLNKRVIPRLTNAHNFSAPGNLPIYHFLCDLQFQNAMSGFSFDRLFNIQGPVTPRVSYENLILKRATWQITKTDIESTSKDKQQGLKNLRNFWQKRNLPQRVTLQQSDNELMIDSVYDDSMLVLLSYIEKSGSVIVVEFPDDDTSFFIESKKGRFNNELIIPLKIDANDKAEEEQADKPGKQVKRTYVPGEEWAYFKVYCGQNTAEEILVKELPQLVSMLYKKKMIDRFFFIRYTDPDFHLRIRFKLKDNGCFADLVSAFRKAFNNRVKQRQVNKLQIDTYVRELERYGSSVIEEAEGIFSNDSLFVMKTLQQIDEMSDDQNRWLVALSAIDAYLDAFGYDTDRKINLLSKGQKSFFKEFGASKTLQQSLNDKYRNCQKSIFNLFNEKSENKYGSLIDIRTAKDAVFIRQICTVYDHSSVDNFLMSYIHMFVNRLFPSENRRYELVLYHFLHKYYMSVKAINKQPLVHQTVAA